MTPRLSSPSASNKTNGVSVADMEGWDEHDDGPSDEELTLIAEERPMNDSSEISMYLSDMGAFKLLSQETEKTLTMGLVETREQLSKALLQFPLIAHKVFDALQDVASGAMLPRRLLFMSGKTGGRQIPLVLERIPSNVRMLEYLFQCEEELLAPLLEEGKEPLPAVRREWKQLRERIADVLADMPVSLSVHEELLEMEAQIAKEAGSIKGGRGRAALLEKKTFLRRQRMYPADAQALHQTIETHNENVEEKRHSIAQGNLRLVVSIANKFRSRGVPLQDMIQDGNGGLMHAIDMYDPRMGFTFGTYATWWIRQAITRALPPQLRMIRLPLYQERISWKVYYATETLQSKLMREPTVAELAQETGMPELAIVEVLGLSLAPISMSQHNVDGEGVPGSFDIPVFPRDTDNEELGDTIEKALLTLHPRDREIICMRFGLKGHLPHTLEQAAQKLGITRERVRQIQEKAIMRLAEGPYAKTLQAFLKTAK